MTSQTPEAPRTALADCKHVQYRQMVDCWIPLIDGWFAHLVLPQHLTRAEADKISAYVLAIAGGTGSEFQRDPFRRGKR